MPRLFGEKLRALRHQHAMTQAELARQMAVKRGHINNIEAGRRTPSLDFVLRAGRFFTVATDYMLRDTISTADIANWTVLAADERSSTSHLFATNLHRLRVQHKLTQATLAHRLGLASHSYISYLETGKKEPSIDLVVQVAEMFEMTTDVLLWGREEMER